MENQTTPVKKGKPRAQEDVDRTMRLYHRVTDVAVIIGIIGSVLLFVKFIMVLFAIRSF